MERVLDRLVPVLACLDLEARMEEVERVVGILLRELEETLYFINS